MKYKRFFMIILVIIILSVSIIGCQNNQAQQKRKTNEKQHSKTKEKNYSTIVTKASDYTYVNMKQQIVKLKEQYEQIIVTSIGKSVGNRNLYLLKLGKGKRKIAVVSGIHGRENMTSLLTLKLLEEYAKHFATNQNIGDYNLKSLLNKVTFYFIPMLNPDGIEIAINGVANMDIRDKSFYIQANESDTNFERWKANGRGVDLNKQFGADWKDVESKDAPHFESYKGPQPESEPESKALAQLTRENKFGAVVTFHHSGSIIYWYYNQQEKRYDKDYKLAKRLSAKNGYELVDPKKSDTKAAGYKDWFIEKFKKPGFTIEIGKGKREGPLPINELDRYFKENKEVLLELAYNLI